MVVTLPPHYCSSCHRFLDQDGAAQGTVSITAERRGKVVAVLARHAIDSSNPQPLTERTRITAGVLPRDFRVGEEGDAVDWPVVLAEYQTRICPDCTGSFDGKTLDLTVLSNHEDQIRGQAMKAIETWQGEGILGEAPAPRTSLHSTDFTLAASWRPYLGGHAASLAWLTFSARLNHQDSSTRWVLLPFHENTPDWSWLLIAPLIELRQHHLADLIRESQPSMIVGVGIARPVGTDHEPTITRSLCLWQVGDSDHPAPHSHLVDDLDPAMLTSLAYQRRER